MPTMPNLQQMRRDSLASTYSYESNIYSNGYDLVKEREEFSMQADEDYYYGMIAPADSAKDRVR